MSSHKMYSNKMLNFQESTTILNACTKKSGKLLNTPRKWFQPLLKPLTLTIQLNICHLFTRLNYQRVLFQTSQFNASHPFAHSLNIKNSLFNPLIRPYLLLLLLERLALGVIAVNGYSAIPKAPALLELHNQIV